MLTVDHEVINLPNARESAETCYTDITVAVYNTLYLNKQIHYVYKAYTVSLISCWPMTKTV